MTIAATVAVRPDRAADPVRPARPTRFTTVVPEVVAAVLDRVESRPGAVATAGRPSRREDRAALLSELRRWFELCDGGRALDEVDRAALRAQFVTLARRGVPLSGVQELWRATIAELFTELWARAEPGDVVGLLRFSRWMVRTAAAAERLMTGVYCASINQRGDSAESGAARVARLITGPAAVSRQRGPQPSAYLVVVSRSRDLPDGLLGHSLTTWHEDRRVTLFPVATAAGRSRVWHDAAANHAGVRAAGVFADAPEGVRAALADARRIDDTALAIGLPPGLIGRRDLALELTLDGPPDRLGHLAGLLDPLAADARLVDTLSVFLRLDLDRTRTAAQLDLSRGGLSRRLERIAGLTGFDPRTTRGVQVLGSALSARALLGLPHPA